MHELMYVYSICIFLSITFRCFSVKNHFLKCQTLPKAFVLLIGWQSLLMPRIAPERNILALSSAMLYLSTLRCYARKTTPGLGMVYLHGHSSGFSPKPLLFRWSSIFTKILICYNAGLGGEVQTQARQLASLWPLSTASSP